MLYPVELRAPRVRDSASIQVGIPLRGEMLVGAEGFEPPTFCSQSRRATRLRYAPCTARPVGARAESGMISLRRRDSQFLEIALAA